MLACTLAVLPRGAAPSIGRRLHATTGGALALLTLASVGLLLSRTFEMNGGVWNTLLPDVRTALAVTHFGHIWAWRVPALAVLWAGWAWGRMRPRQSRAAGWLMLCAAALIALTRSDTGHPADHGDFTLAVWIDWLHMLAAATWVGSLFGMTLAVYPRLQDAPAHAEADGAEIFQRLSTLSGAALAVLLAGGIYNAWQQLGPVSALWTTRYGAVLDVKLGVVLLMLLFGAHNRYVKLPRVLRAAGRTPRASFIRGMLERIRRGRPVARRAGDITRTCARAVLIESLLGLVVIGATATLIHAMPPADMAAMPMAAGMGHLDHAP